ncbi:MAG: hypothetical protein ABII27_01680 [bacterium]
MPKANRLADIKKVSFARKWSLVKKDNITAGMKTRLYKVILNTLFASK